MYVKIPVLRDLKDAHGIDASLRSHCWEISVAQRGFDSSYTDGMYWSILLSVLIPAIHGKKSERFLLKFLRMAVGPDKDIDENEVRRNIFAYNPFLNRYACFHVDVLKNLVTMMYERVSEFRKVYEQRVSTTKTTQLKDEFWFDVIAQKLECKITLISEKSREDELCPSILDVPRFSTFDGTCGGRDGKTECDFNILLYGKRTDEPWLVISFGLDYDIGEKLQKTAFEKILGMAGLQGRCEKLLHLEGIRDNFICTLLQEERYYYVLEELFKHPTHVFNKLHEAGFNVDPTKTVENFPSEYRKRHLNFKPSAYFFAIETGRLNLMNSLHTYATNKSSSIDCSFRDPDFTLIENMVPITSTLKGMKEFYDTADCRFAESNVSYHFDELFKFHRFQYRICKELVKFSKNVPCYEGLLRLILHAEDQKDIILSILNIYLEYFNMLFDVPSHPWILLFEPYDTFRERNNFFRNLDFTAAPLFFDRSYSLKFKLKLTDDTHEEMESSFLRFLFFSKYYYRKLNRGRGPPENHDEIFFVLAHLERNKLLRQLKKFTKILSETIVDKDNAREEVPESELHTLTRDPEIKDEFVVMRLKHYLELALKVDLNENFQVGRLVVLRALQVLGETIKLKPSEKPSVIQSLLVSCLPDDVAKDLCRVRDNLSHINSQLISVRLDLKDKKTLFIGLITEIRMIRKSMEHIFNLAKAKIRLYLLEGAKTSMMEWWDDQEVLNYRRLSDRLKYIGFLDHAPDEERRKDENNPSRQTYVSDLRKKYFEILNPDMDIVKGEIKKEVQTLIRSHSYHFTRICSRTEESGTTKDHKDQDSVMKVGYLFGCMEVLIKFVLESLQLDPTDKMSLLERFETIPCHNQKKEYYEEGKLIGGKKLVKDLRQAYREFRLQIRVYPDDDDEEEQDSILLRNEYRNIHSLKVLLDGQESLSVSRKDEIRDSVPEKYRNHYDARRELIKSFKESIDLTEEETEQLFSTLLFKKEKIESMRAAYEKNNLSRIENAKHQCDTFLDCLEKDRINENDLEYARANFEFSDAIIKDLEQIRLRRGVGVQDKTLEFFLDRIKTMKELLIDSDAQFQYMWNNAKSEKTKVYIRKKLAAVYAARPELQACIEVLLFDCTNLMKGRKIGLTHLYRKTEYLFNGINLRNFFAHGNPLFEAVSKMLDPYDLPNDIMKKVLELVTDLDVLEAMFELKESRCKYFEDFEKFVEIRDDKNEELAKIRLLFKDCDKFRKYLYFLSKIDFEKFAENRDEENEELAKIRLSFKDCDKFRKYLYFLSKIDLEKFVENRDDENEELVKIRLLFKNCDNFRKYLYLVPRKDSQKSSK